MKSPTKSVSHTKVDVLLPLSVSPQKHSSDSSSENTIGIRSFFRSHDMFYVRWFTLEIHKCFSVSILFKMTLELSALQPCAVICAEAGTLPVQGQPYSQNKFLSQKEKKKMNFRGMEVYIALNISCKSLNLLGKYWLSVVTSEKETWHDDDTLVVYLPAGEG